ncbi:MULTISPECIES: pitrilysin family protein [unclassified Caulobacter]|uniref:M16 family metallopeptidase n=1 Tax=unclassified Caulobacter TaxID=2648921 RepID=UPI0007807EFA|nr:MULTISPECIES: pitrilysin family protein [unclassified Caulobacter]AZS19729.1 insulinase family protein [Caulobacter sp. FWC26]
MTASLRTLKNGVRVVCDPMPGLETLALSVVAGRGAAYEDPARSGWSHLLEHMVFKGAGSRSARDIVEVIENQGGSINAATGYERTSFQVRALKGGLDLGMDVIADLVRRPTLDGADLAREKQVVAQEIAEAADAPDDYVFDLIQRASWGDHPVGRPILGSDETVNAATVEALSDWRADLYAADRLVIAATGAVEEGELMAAAERAFGDLPATPGASVPSPAAFVGGPLAEARKLEQAHLVFMLPACGAREDDYFALRIFAECLGGGMSSRLFQEAREKRGLAYNIDAYADTYADHGALGIYAGCAAGDAVETAKVCADELLKLADRIEEAELARAKAQLKAHMFMAREQPLSRAEQGAGQVLLFGRLYPPAELAREVDAVTPADVARLGRRLVSAGRAATAVLGAKSALKAGEAFDKALFSAA